MTSSIFDTALHQMLVFAIVLVAGFVAARLGIIKKDTMSALSRLIVSILLPALIFQSTYTGITRDEIPDNLIILALTFAFYVVVSAVLIVCAKAMRLKGDKGHIFEFCFIFGNTGFVGFPLVLAVFPEHGVACMTFFTLIDQAIFWTYGVYLSTSQEGSAHVRSSEHVGHSAEEHKHRFDPKSLISPNTIALALGFIFVVAGISVPGVISDALGAVANTTSALCMMYLGALICFTDCLSVLKRVDLYVGILVKMIALPLVIGHLLLWWGILPAQTAQCFAMICALPTMTMVPILASKNGHEGAYAAGVTAVTLAASVVSIPLVMLLL